MTNDAAVAAPPNAPTMNEANAQRNAAGETRRRSRLFLDARTRIVAATVLLLALSLLTSLILVRQILFADLDRQINNQLEQEGEEFRKLVGGIDPRTGEPFGKDLEAIFEVFFQRNVTDEGEQILALLGGRPYKSRASGQIPVSLAGNDRAIEQWGRLSSTEVGRLETPHGSVHYLAVPVKTDGEVRGTFVVANFPAFERAEINAAVRTAAQVGLVVLVFASGLAWLLAARVLEPLRLLTQTARSISDSDLSQRIPVSGGDDVARMAATFNDMLDRLQTAFGTQRQFIDDAGHELRTPITVIRGHLELLELVKDDPKEREATVALVMDELDRMSRIVNELLLLAKARRPDFLTLEPVDLAELTPELHQKALALGRRDWRLETSGRGTVLADRQRVTQAVMQLAQNAAQHTSEDATITLGSAVSNGEVRFWVRDSGPGIAPAQHTRIFDRFSRTNSATRHSDGAGLGLAIVSAIAEAHGGRAEVDSRTGEGATFTLVIPRRGPSPETSAEWQA